VCNGQPGICQLSRRISTDTCASRKLTRRPPSDGLGGPGSQSQDGGEHSLGSAEYQWHDGENGGHEQPDGPATKTTLQRGADGKYTLPKASIIVLRGKIGE
jgi:hypothetical protein